MEIGPNGFYTLINECFKSSWIVIYFFVENILKSIKKHRILEEYKRFFSLVLLTHNTQKTAKIYIFKKFTKIMIKKIELSTWQIKEITDKKK